MVLKYWMAAAGGMFNDFIYSQPMRVHPLLQRRVIGRFCNRQLLLRPAGLFGERRTSRFAYLVGHTIDEVERELILHTLIHCCGSRTRSANILGISIRCMRNKIHEYEDLGIAVRAPREPRVGRTS